MKTKPAQWRYTTAAGLPELPVYAHDLPRGIFFIWKARSRDPGVMMKTEAGMFVYLSGEFAGIPYREDKCSTVEVTVIDSEFALTPPQV